LDGDVVQHVEYVPFGEVFIEERNNTWNTPFLFNAKELDEETGLYYYGARYYDPRTSVFLGVDPLAEKYPGISSYVYCANNPIKFVDPDGRDVVLTGALTEEALKQLQNAATYDITLTMNKNGTICYTKNVEGDLNFRAAAVAEIIDNSSIIVNVNTIDGDKTSTGNLFIGGAFMGNEVHTMSDGSNVVIANQEINPNVLGAADNQTGTPGMMTLHEVTEAYQGGKISQASGVSSSMSGQPGSVYSQAHNAAFSQNPIYQTMYDANGKVTTNVNSAVRVDWSVTRPTNIISKRERVIQTLR
jgi:RHS repeat-associated protein